MIKQYGKVVITEDNVSIEEFHFDGAETGSCCGDALEVWAWAIARIIAEWRAEKAEDEKR